MIPPVVDASWLAEHTGEVVLADVRWYLDGRSGRDAYDGGHLPGAVFADLDRWLAAEPSPSQGRHPLPEPEVFARGMGELGIGDAATVVAYDDAGGTIAARLVWMLRVTGHDAALLDGGLTGWSGPLSRTPAAPAQTTFTAVGWPAERLAQLAELAGAGHLIDARQAERFRGEVEPVDARPGHIPGAKSLPCRESVDANGRFLPLEALRSRLAGAGIRPGDDIVAYCGSGVTACHNLVMLELAGFGPGRLYPGSWSQYAATDLPAATGS
ncbi:MAG: thiosulfate/3-mercaptopyruvate sulfurtransferase [Frankiales bacterium]|nr:thiosulfate/3-mercaptopyruvate sulfurtransferase [Frankiales bacterium]